jgi:hypothetical protein
VKIEMVGQFLVQISIFKILESVLPATEQSDFNIRPAGIGTQPKAR